jgi:hypothetical protein
VSQLPSTALAARSSATTLTSETKRWKLLGLLYSSPAMEGQYDQ